jgi:hypothetical protein
MPMLLPMFKQLTILKNVFIFCFLTIICLELRAQTNASQKSISDSIEQVKTLMRKNGSVTSYATGIDGTLSNQFQRFIYLLNHLNTDEFLALANDTNTCIRIYAYAGLIYNRYKKIDLIKTQFRTDSTLIPYMAGCAGGNLKAYAIISNLKQWYNKTNVTFSLRQQIQNKTFWYTNFVFHD